MLQFTFLSEEKRGDGLSSVALFCGLLLYNSDTELLIQHQQNRAEPRTDADDYDDVKDEMADNPEREASLALTL